MRRLLPLALIALVPGCYTLDFDGDGIPDRGPVAGYETDEIACSNGRDDDLDGRIDCADEDCLSLGFCAEYIPLTPPLGVENTFELCSNHIDDDLDGQFDCGDRDCQNIFELCCSSEFSDASCSDGIDNEGNGFADCADYTCRNNPYVTVCDVETDCANGRDDDGDRLADCRDSDCQDFPGCAERNCTDGIDNDNDGLIDCLDPSCVDLCVPETVCDDGVDNDGDTATDCRDPDCMGTSACSGPENTLAFCSDGVDNDGDPYVDCADRDCSTSTDPDIMAYCASLSETSLEQCMDGIDNDGNGFIDCGDYSCSRSTTNPEVVAYCDSIGENTVERCMDGIDNDGNGFTDCNDFSCSRASNSEVVEYCRQFGEANYDDCVDGRDNNRNGFVDCADYSCRFIIVSRTGLCSDTSECPLGQSCYRGACLLLRGPCSESMWIDDTQDIQGNEDGSLPTDSTRAEQIAMAVRTCTDGIDNDLDGFTDCEDWECNHNPLVVDSSGQPLCRHARGRTCVAGPRAGQTCGSDTDCMTDYSGACALPGPEGQAFVCPGGR
ncbi:MAG: hypothetical protein KC619_13815 [Myxococcales bacterium]|nr:hypothetical protein [Myxococcales bacterium]